MYLEHWRLNASPFHATAGTGPAYPSEAYQEATARIEYLVTERRRVGALIGEPGLGKSTVAQAVGPLLAGRGAAVAVVDAVALSPQELLWRTATQIGAEPDQADESHRLWRRIEDRLSHRRWLGQETVLVVDDADQAGPDVQRQLVRLAGLESAPGARWTILLASGPKGLSRIVEPMLQLIDMRVDLYPWSQEDTAGYVQHALVDAGRFEPIFTDEALVRLQEKSLGVPRHVARLADFALVLGAGAGLEVVGPEQLDTAFEELRWSPPVEVDLV